MKRILAMTICIAILATAAITGSIAYFTDSDAATNVFTVGNVVIEQHEQERTNDNALQNFTNPVVGRLHPMVERAGDEKWSAMPGNESIHLRSLDHWANYVDKIVTIENKGKSEAYVRNIVAIPTGLPAGAEDVPWLEADWFDAEKKTSADWTKAEPIRDVDIDGALYDIYVINYKTALAPNATTTPTLLGVGLSKNVDYEETDGTGTYYYKDENGKRTNISLDPESMKIYVATQAVQAAGFDTADAAFNATFGAVSAAIFGGTGGSTGGDSTSTVVSGGKIGEDSFDWNYLTNTNNKDSKGNPYVQVNDSKTLTAISPDLTELYVDGSAVKTVKISGKIYDYPPGHPNYRPNASYTSSNLQTLVIGEGVTEIAKEGCSEFENLTSITLPASLKTIGDSAFYKCIVLKTVKLADGNANKLPSGVTSIESAAFAECEDLEELDLSGLTGLSTFNDGIFNLCESLKSVRLPINITSIGGNVFAHCTALQEITIPEKVTEIDNQAFMYCAKLKSVTIKSTGAISFGYSAFANCCTADGTDKKLKIITKDSSKIAYVESEDNSTFDGTDFIFESPKPQ